MYYISACSTHSPHPTPLPLPVSPSFQRGRPRPAADTISDYWASCKHLAQTHRAEHAWCFITGPSAFLRIPSHQFSAHVSADSQSSSAGDMFPRSSVSYVPVLTSVWGAKLASECLWWRVSSGEQISHQNWQDRTGAPSHSWGHHSVWWPRTGQHHSSSCRRPVKSRDHKQG